MSKICLWLPSDRTPLSTIVGHTNQRSLHAMPTPHTDSLTILLGIGMLGSMSGGRSTSYSISFDSGTVTSEVGHKSENL